MMTYFIVFVIVFSSVLLWDLFEKPKQQAKKPYNEDEIALAEFLKKRQEINELFLVAQLEIRKFSRK